MDPLSVDHDTHDHDVVVIGAGGAGLRAAIEASGQGAKTALVCKSLLGKAHTVMAEGGAAAALRNTDRRDNWKVHFRDTMRGGKFLNQWKMAQIHAQEAPDRVRELENWGAVMDRQEDGWMHQRNFGGHTYPRLAHVGDRTGLELIRTLQQKGVHSGLDVFMETTVVRILREGTDGPVAGCLAYERASGRFHLFRAKAIVIATGGVGKIYHVTSNSWEYTGDGQGLAYQAGAELMDMEYVQFHPTGMIWPPSVRGILVTEGVRGDGGVLRNSEGARFMFDNIPEMFKGDYAETEEEAQRWLDGDPKAKRPPELLTRDVVARAIRKQVQEGKGTPHGGAWLDISWRPADFIQRKLPSMYHQFMELAGVDITREAMEVGPTMHYIMGGIRVDAETTQTRVPGLFAAGEAASGMHGANRLGGNSLTDLLVFGKRAGEHAARHAARQEAPRIDAEQVEAGFRYALEALERPKGENPFAVHEALQDVMQEHAGMVRDAQGLGRAIEGLEDLRRRWAGVKAPGTRAYNPGWHTALDLENMLIAAEAIARHALMREESRGAHTRSDFDGTDEAKWARVNVVSRKGPDGAMQVETVPLPEWPADVRQVVESSSDALSSKLEVDE